MNHFNMDDEKLGMAYEFFTRGSIGLVKPKQAFKSTRNAFKKLPQNFFLNLFNEFSTDCLIVQTSSITAKAMGLIFFHCTGSLQPEMCLLVYCSTYNAFFMDLPVSSSVFPSSLLTTKSVNLAVASFP